MARAYDVWRLVDAASALLVQLNTDFGPVDDSPVGKLRATLISAIGDLHDELSHLERDGVPTAYVATNGSTSTHRMQSSDIRVWCATAEDAIRLMTLIDRLAERVPYSERAQFMDGGAS